MYHLFCTESNKIEDFSFTTSLDTYVFRLPSIINIHKCEITILMIYINNKYLFVCTYSGVYLNILHFVVLSVYIMSTCLKLEYILLTNLRYIRFDQHVRLYFSWYTEYINCSKPFLPTCNTQTVSQIQTYDITLGLICKDLFSGKKL